MNTYDYVIETYRNGDNWYRKYKNGWIEQGGKVALSPSTKTINFLKPFSDTNYLFLSTITSDNLSYGYGNPALSGKTTTSIRVIGESYTIYWFVCGQGA